MSYIKFEFALISILVFAGINLVSAHEGEVEEASTDESVFIIILIAIFAGVFPLLIGYSLVDTLNKIEFLKEDNFGKTYAASVGVLVFLIFDYVGLSAVIGLEFESNTRKILTFLVFLLYFAFLIISERYFGPSSIVYLWAIGIGIHSFTEGIIMGFNLTIGLRVAFSLFPLTSFILHKIAEGFTGAALFLREELPSFNRTLLISLIAGLPIVPGVVIGYVSGQNDVNSVATINPYLYTTSVVATIYMIPIFLNSITNKDTYQSKTYTLWIFLGFTFMYFAALLHEVN